MINTGPRQLLSRDSGIYDGIGDAMCSEFRPGDETEVQEILLPETGKPSKNVSISSLNGFSNYEWGCHSVTQHYK